MSDTIKTLNEVLAIAARRYPEKGFGDQEEERDTLLALLEEIVTAAGDCLEDHVKASLLDPRQYRKERTYRKIVERIAVHFADTHECVEETIDTYAKIREILASFDIKTQDYTGKTVKIK